MTWNRKSDATSAQSSSTALSTSAPDLNPSTQSFLLLLPLQPLLQHLLVHHRIILTTFVSKDLGPSRQRPIDLLLAPIPLDESALHRVEVVEEAVGNVGGEVGVAACAELEVLGDRVAVVGEVEDVTVAAPRTTGPPETPRCQAPRLVQRLARQRLLFEAVVVRPQVPCLVPHLRERRSSAFLAARARLLPPRPDCCTKVCVRELESDI